MDPREAMPACRDAAETALEIDDTLADAHTVLAIYHQDYAWDHEAVARALDRALELEPAVESIQRALELSGPTTVWRAWLGYAYALAAHMARADSIRAMLVREIADGSPISANLAVGIAMIEIGRRNWDEAFRWIQEAIDSRSTVVPFLLSSPVGRRLEEDPRYREMLRLIHLPLADSLVH